MTPAYESNRPAAPYALGNAPSNTRVDPKICMLRSIFLYLRPELIS
ncbi:MAG TPA: hypothetical protein VFF81_02355 [Noviherbaspirillum sp.]|nr:hypothetical protein [Noviherbaspirillum sp.]